MALLLASPRRYRGDPIPQEGGENLLLPRSRCATRGTALLLASPRCYRGAHFLRKGVKLVAAATTPFAPKGITHAARNTTCMVVPAAVSGDGMTALPD